MIPDTCLCAARPELAPPTNHAPCALPLAALRAQKVAALLALAHQAGVPIPANMHLSDEPHESDLRFHTLDPAIYHAWSKWLNATECRDYPGSEFRTALATADLQELGRVTAHFAVKKDA